MVHSCHQAISAPEEDSRKDRGPTSTKATRNLAQGKPTQKTGFIHPHIIAGRTGTQEVSGTKRTREQRQGWRETRMLLCL